MNIVPPFKFWLDDFFAAYYHRRPVNATFIGVHEFDHLLPDFSEAACADTLAEMEHLLQKLYTYPVELLNATDYLDRNLAEGFLRLQDWEYRSNHFQRANPCVYTGEAIFGVMSLFLTAGNPLADRYQAAIARLEAIPAFLAQGQANLHQAPRAWSERAIQECQGAIAFLEDGLTILITETGLPEQPLLKAASRAAAAFHEFQSFLQNDLLLRPFPTVACGEEIFTQYVRQGHFIDTPLQDMLAYARDQLSLSQAYLDQHAADFGATSPQQALSQLNQLHPSTNEYLARYADFWQASRQVCLEHDLLSWPEFPLEYVPQPRWARKAAPYLYFLFYRAPAAFNRPPVHRYLVTPIEPDMPPEEQERLLCAHNDSVIKLNHVVHHGGIGHHVQNYYAYRAASRIGQIAAVDTASRIAMFCGGTMAEGWALYATDLMNEIGFLTPLEAYSEQQSRRRFCARAIVDIQLHCGQFTLDQAARFYQQAAGMNPAFAYNEAVKNSMNPGAAVMYLFGCDEIKRLRQEMSRLWGADFNLRRFHDTFLSYGSIPVTLISRDMIAKTTNLPSSITYE